MSAPYAPKSGRSLVVLLPLLPHLEQSSAVRRRGGVHKPRRKPRERSVLEASVLCGFGS